MLKMYNIFVLISSKESLLSLQFLSEFALLFAVRAMIFVRHPLSENSVTTLQNRAPIFRVVKIGLKSVKKVVMSMIILGWGS